MEAVDFDVKDFEDRYNGDKSVYARFYIRPVQDEHASAAEGRPIFKDKEYVEIIAAGNSNNIVRRPVSDMDRQRFYAAYGKFKQGDQEQMIGTPLTEVPWITRSQCEELNYLKIRTLEQLGSLDDQACGKIPGLYDLKRKAGAALESAAGSAPIHKLQKENDELKAQIAALQDAVKEQTAVLKKLQEK